MYQNAVYALSVNVELVAMRSRLEVVRPHVNYERKDGRKQNNIVFGMDTNCFFFYFVVAFRRRFDCAETAQQAPTYTATCVTRNIFASRDKQKKIVKNSIIALRIY